MFTKSRKIYCCVTKGTEFQGLVYYFLIDHLMLAGSAGVKLLSVDRNTRSYASPENCPAIWAKQGAQL